MGKSKELGLGIGRAPIPQMKRVLIIGPSGAGKSTLARRLGETLGLEVIHLDAEFWRPGWVETPAEEWKRRVQELIRGERWAMDGNFSGTLPERLEAADTVIYLDFPRWRCFAGVLRRWRKHCGQTRPDMAPGCPEKIDFAFLKWIWNYPRRSRPKTLRLLEEYRDRKTVIILRGPKSVADFERDILSNANQATPRTFPQS